MLEIEKMKIAELKAALRERGAEISGQKPKLVERLRAILESEKQKNSIELIDDDEQQQEEENVAQEQFITIQSDDQTEAEQKTNYFSNQPTHDEQQQERTCYDPTNAETTLDEDRPVDVEPSADQECAPIDVNCEDKQGESNPMETEQDVPMNEGAESNNTATEVPAELDPLTKETAETLIKEMGHDDLVRFALSVIPDDMENSVLNEIYQKMERDPKRCRVFCRNLPYDTDDDKLKALFSIIGHVTETIIITEKGTKRPRGFGFVSFPCNKLAKAACNTTVKTPCGREIEVSMATPRGEFDRNVKRPRYSSPDRDMSRPSGRYPSSSSGPVYRGPAPRGPYYSDMRMDHDSMNYHPMGRDRGYDRSRDYGRDRDDGRLSRRFDDRRDRVRRRRSMDRRY